MSETAVTSFVIRFIQEQGVDLPPTAWRGLIRHVQTSEETNFTHIAEALTFMARYVKIDDCEVQMGD